MEALQQQLDAVARKNSELRQQLLDVSAEKQRLVRSVSLFAEDLLSDCRSVE